MRRPRPDPRGVDGRLRGWSAVVTPDGFLLNGEPLPEKNGAPLRMRVERQLGYKHPKYLTAIEAVASLDGIGGGKGGYWEDRSGYQWYAGV